MFQAVRDIIICSKLTQMSDTEYVAGQQIFKYKNLTMAQDLVSLNNASACRGNTLSNSQDIRLSVTVK